MEPRSSWTWMCSATCHTRQSSNGLEHPTSPRCFLAPVDSWIVSPERFEHL